MYFDFSYCKLPELDASPPLSFHPNRTIIKFRSSRMLVQVGLWLEFRLDWTLSYVWCGKMAIFCLSLLIIVVILPTRLCAVYDHHVSNCFRAKVWEVCCCKRWWRTSMFSNLITLGFYMKIMAATYSSILERLSKSKYRVSMDIVWSRVMVPMQFFWIHQLYCTMYIVHTTP